MFFLIVSFFPNPGAPCVHSGHLSAIAARLAAMERELSALRAAVQQAFAQRPAPTLLNTSWIPNTK